MDKNKTGKNPSPDRDDMELKALLNASFDKDNLTVSEDLIQRTLLKIKEAEDKENSDEIFADDKRKSVLKFPVRRFAGAAAILLLVSAVWVYQNNMTGAKQDKTGSDQLEQQFSIAESAENSALSAAEGDESQELEDNAVASTAKEAPLEDSKLAAGEEAQEKAADTAAPADNGSSMLTLVAPEVLSELYPINAEEVVTFKVLKAEEKQNDSAEKSLKEPAVKAAKLYELLTAYTVQASETDASGDILYSYEITTKDKNVITYEFYQEVVKVTDGRLPGKAVTYTVNEQADLLEKLAEFITK